MKKIILIILVIFSVASFTKVDASTVVYLWENIVIPIPVNDSIDNYKDLPICNVYVSDTKQNVEVNYRLDTRYFSLTTLNTNKVGTYYLDYEAVIPFYNYVSSQRVRFEVYDGIAPEITTINQIILLEENIDVNNYIAITDNYDKYSDLDITIDQRGFNNKEVGTYEIKITVIDKSLNKSMESLFIDVIDTENPIITPREKETRIPYGLTAFDPSGYYEAYDEYDKFITGDIKVLNQIDFYKLGEQEIVLSVTDSSGNTFILNSTILIVDEEKPTLQLFEYFIDVDNVSEINDTFLRGLIRSVNDNESDLTPDDVFINYSDLSNHAGTYFVSYVLTDFSGNETFATLEVKVIKSLSIESQISDIQINVGEIFNYQDYILIEQMNGVQYFITLKDDNLNINKPGNYFIDVIISDSLNNQKEARLIVEVIDTNQLSGFSDTFKFGKNDVYIILGLAIALGYLVVILKNNRKSTL